ncbi:MAG: hypothetical protein IKN17_13075 [Ruminococcus sp.]|nr:hypothetical protein [Ruminococcus sp.]
MKKEYTELELEVIEFGTDDVIVTSFGSKDTLNCPEHSDMCFGDGTNG